MSLATLVTLDCSLITGEIVASCPVAFASPPGALEVTVFETTLGALCAPLITMLVKSTS